MQKYNPEEWYTPPQAQDRLSKNSGKKIHESYLRTLANAGKIERLKIAEKYSLYKKSDIDGYVVADRKKKREESA